MKIIDLPAEERNLRRTKTDFVVIYALIDPRNDGIRYIGKTEKRLARRLDEHIRFPVNRGTRAWIAELRADGMAPKIEPITCCGQQFWEGKEAFWIRWCRIRGVRLLNRDPGGVCRFKSGRLNTTGRVKNFIAKRCGRKPAVVDFWPEKRKRIKEEKLMREANERARACGVKVYSKSEIAIMNRTLAERPEATRG